MSKSEILDGIVKLSADERWEIRLKLAELDGDGWVDEDDPLTNEQKDLLDARLANMEQLPDESIPWDEVKLRLEEQIGK